MPHASTSKVQPLLKGDSLSVGPKIKDGIALFWGGWASNWAPAMFEVDGQQYNCVEQFFMAEKARLFADDAAREKILASRYPKAQKELGRAVRNFNKEKWNGASYRIMAQGVRAKFEQNAALKAKICGVPPSVRFAEASPYDDIWGIGMAASDPAAATPAKWKGQNLLGKALDAARKAACPRKTR